MPRRTTFRHHDGVMQMVIRDPDEPGFEIVIDEDPVHVAHMAAMMTDAVSKHLYDLKKPRN